MKKGFFYTTFSFTLKQTNYTRVLFFDFLCLHFTPMNI